jgi:hypothetical protein
MASTQSATSIDRAADNWTDSVGQTFSNVSDAFSSARAPASMGHCKADFKLPSFYNTPRGLETMSFGHAGRPARLKIALVTRNRLPFSRSQVM